MGVSLHLEERNRVLKRTLKSNLLAYMGPKLKIDNPIVGKLVSAMMSVTQIISTEKDKEAKCTNYPNETFGSYSECDEIFLYKKLKKIGIIPFWATNNLSIVTKSRFHRVICC